MTYSARPESCYSSRDVPLTAKRLVLRSSPFDVCGQHHPLDRNYFEDLCWTSRYQPSRHASSGRQRYQGSSCKSICVNRFPQNNVLIACAVSVFLTRFEVALLPSTLHLRSLSSTTPSRSIIVSSEELVRQRAARLIRIHVIRLPHLAKLGMTDHI
jgi:hypothetical protein